MRNAVLIKARARCRSMTVNHIVHMNTSHEMGDSFVLINRISA
jgi:hypothetical protein